MNKYLKFSITVVLDLTLVGLILMTGYSDNEVYGNILWFSLFVLCFMFFLIMCVGDSITKDKSKHQELYNHYVLFQDRFKYSTHWSVMSTLMICFALAGIGWMIWAIVYFVMFLLALGVRFNMVTKIKEQVEGRS